MRKYTKLNSVFYYPEENVNVIDTEELKIIVENPTGYGVGDSVRLIYTFAPDDVEVGVNTFEMFSPLVNFGGVNRAIFYIPLTAEFANDSISFSPGVKQTDFIIKTKGSTDFDPYTNFLDRNYSLIYLTNSNPTVRSNPIPVFFFSERGAGLFENKILNRQFRTADTNFSSVAIRQDKFNPFFMDVGGRNLVEKTNQGITNITMDSSAGGATWTLSEEIVDGVRCAKGTKNTTAIETWSLFNLRIYNPSKFRANQQYAISFKMKPSFAINNQVTRLSTITNQGLSTNSGYSLVAGEWNHVKLVVTTLPDFDTILAGRPTVHLRLNIVDNSSTGDTVLLKDIKIEEGNKATDWTPAPEDYEVTEVVSGADLAEGMDKFNASYAFKLLDDSEWVTKKLVCPENYIQLFWGEPRSTTRFSFWFEIKEIEKSSEAWGEVEHDRELRVGEHVKERRKDVTKYRFPKTKLRLSSGVFRQDIIDQLKGIVHSPTVYRYNPYTKLNVGGGVFAQVTEMRDMNGMPTTQLGPGHFRLADANNFSNIIEELINSPITSNFALEFSVKGRLVYVGFLANRDDLSNPLFIASSITTADFTKYTFSGSIYFDRDKKVKPALWFIAPPGGSTEIKDIYIKGYLGGIEDVEVEISTMNIIPHQDGESEMELTVISDDIRKPDYLYF